MTNDRTPPAGEPMTRRTALRTAGYALGAGLAVTALARDTPALATTGTMQYGAANDAGTDPTSLTSSGSPATLTVSTSGAAASAFVAQATDPAATGIVAEVVNPGTGITLRVRSANPANASPLIEVLGAHTGIGVNVANSRADNPNPVIQAASAGDGPGFAIVCTNPANTSSALIADQLGTGTGLRASSTTGPAVLGESSAGPGGVFRGKTAQIRLRPSAARTHPETGLAGNLFVDRYARLWYCKGGTNWIKLA